MSQSQLHDFASTKSSHLPSVSAAMAVRYGRISSNMAGIHIKPSHEGVFTAKAARAGEGVQEFAQHQLHSNDPATRKQANFARMAKRHFQPLPKKSSGYGGKVFAEK